MLITLSAVGANLKQLNRDTEADFLGIGGMLTGFMSSALQVSSDVSEITELVSGEKGQAAAAPYWPSPTQAMVLRLQCA